jgi:dienelactone hydrolase
MLLRAGLDVVLVQLPFHGDRSPRGVRSGGKFPSPHVVRTNEAFAHAIRDLRALVDWLYRRGAPAVGAMGMSLGGYTTALLATCEPRLSFAVPMIPMASLADVMWGHGEGRPSRARAERAGVTGNALEAAFAIHCPLNRAPLVPFDRRFIIAGLGDRITPPEQAKKLAAHWGDPRQHWFPGGHLMQFKRREAFRVLRWFLIETGVVSGRRPVAAAG